MTGLLLKNALVYQNNNFASADVLCSDDKIVSVCKNIEPKEDIKVFDCHAMRLAPGFIDAHTHGGAGVDVNAASSNDLIKIAKFFASHGVTGWLASVLTDTKEQTLHCIEQIKTAMNDHSGARLLGIHLEGPFLSKEFKGAMPAQLLQNGNLSLFNAYQKAADGNIKYITVSPEVEGIPEFVKAVASEVSVAIGHSGADYETSMNCIENGARCVTHTFNAMKLFHQHFPAIMGAALESEAWCEAICDGRHLHPASVRLLIKAKGLDRVIAVTDSIMAAGLADGRYTLGVNDVIVENSDAKLASNGVRAGSTLTMDSALRNLVEFTGRPVEEVLPMLTQNVADALRLKSKGRIAPNMDADFVLLGNNLEVLATIVGGEIVFS